MGFISQVGQETLTGLLHRSIEAQEAMAAAMNRVADSLDVIREDIRTIARVGDLEVAEEKERELTQRLDVQNKALEAAKEAAQG